MSTNESETQLSAPTSPFKQFPKRLAQKDKESRESAPLQNKHSTLRKSLQISGHYTTHPMSTEWAISRWLLLHSVSECLIRLDEPLGSSKVESPSPICQSQSRDWLGESVLVLLNGQKHKPVSQWARQSRAIPNIHHTLPRQRSCVGTPYRRGNGNHKFKN